MPRFDYHPSQITRARELRREMTRYEKKLWLRLRGSQLGVAFRKQHPIGPYIVDFASPEISLIIEVDGGQHGTPQGTDSDQARDGFFATKGWQVMRFWNSDVFENCDGVVETIFLKIQALKPAPT